MNIFSYAHRVHTIFLILLKLAQACDINQFKRALTFKLRIIIRTELVFPVSEPATTEILVRGGRRGPVKRIRIANDLTPGKEAELEN